MHVNSTDSHGYRRLLKACIGFDGQKELASIGANFVGYGYCRTLRRLLPGILSKDERRDEMAKHHIAGGKITDSHGTVIGVALDVVRVAERLPEVTKISLGPITPGLHAGSRRTLKFDDVPSGVTAIVCGPTSKQVLHIYTSDPVGTKNILGVAFYGEEEWRNRLK